VLQGVGGIGCGCGTPDGMWLHLLKTWWDGVVMVGNVVGCGCGGWNTCLNVVVEVKNLVG